MNRYEAEVFASGFKLIAGIDEAGRGPLAGPVVAAAVILPKEHNISGIDDSKKLSPAKREKLFIQITNAAITYSIAEVGEKTIDEINILEASRLAMARAARALDPEADYLLIDGTIKIDFPLPQKAIIKGDSLSYSIAAASILAKVERDRIMLRYHEIYPMYGFDRHKGYPTKEHINCLKEFGPCDIHRKSFRHVKEFRAY